MFDTESSRDSNHQIKPNSGIHSRAWLVAGFVTECALLAIDAKNLFTFLFIKTIKSV